MGLRFETTTVVGTHAGDAMLLPVAILRLKI